MNTVTLLKNFTFVGDDGDGFITDWVHFPAEHKNATLFVHAQTYSPGTASTGLAIQLQSSFDTVQEVNVGSAVNVIATGSQSSALSADLAPMVRIEITNNDSVPVFAILSIWLQPKSE